ncbi:ClpP/crotonase [Ramaria rubella]|nr:ClpP/crotonase [Ramaria rubella]
MSSQASYSHILTSRPELSVSLITLNRPKALNALSTPPSLEINRALDEAENDADIGASLGAGIDTGVAGAEMKETNDRSIYTGSDFLHNWTQITKMKAGHCCSYSPHGKLGGGCELAMMYDIIFASPTSTFGQPEINLSVIPGAGRTQRHTRAIGKSRTIELVLTGQTWGLVSRVVREGEGEVVREAVQMAKTTANKGRHSMQAAKEAVDSGKSMMLSFELLGMLSVFRVAYEFNLQEGMGTFAEKRKPTFTNS